MAPKGDAARRALREQFVSDFRDNAEIFQGLDARSKNARKLACQDWLWKKMDSTEQEAGSAIPRYPMLFQGMP